MEATGAPHVMRRCRSASLELTRRTSASPRARLDRRDDRERIVDRDEAHAVRERSTGALDARERERRKAEAVRGRDAVRIAVAVEPERQLDAMRPRGLRARRRELRTRRSGPQAQVAA